MPAALALAGLCLRWWRIGLASFRYDAAETLFVAYDTIGSGHPPLLGIVNSLGFCNPPAFTWFLLPSMLVSPDPAVVTAWQALLTVTAVWPLWWIGRRYLGRGAALFLCAAYALMPAEVGTARSIWSLSLMPAVACWGLYWTLLAQDNAVTARRRGWALIGAVVAHTLNALMHLSGLLWLAIALVFLARPVRAGGIPRRHAVAAAVALAALLLFLVPCAGDWLARRQTKTSAKPAHIEKFESQMSAPKPVAGRIAAAYSGLLLQLCATTAQAGFEPLLPDTCRRTMAVGELLTILLALAGVATAVLHVRAVGRDPGAPEDARGGCLPALLLAWSLPPPLVAGVLLGQISGAYFALAQPALLMLAAYAMAAAMRSHRLPVMRTGRAALVLWFLLVPAASVWYLAASNEVIDQERWVNGPHYIPLEDQKRVARMLVQERVPRGGLYHLSGKWYQHPYDYLHQVVYRASAAPVAGSHYAVIEDLRLRGRQPRRTAFVAEKATRSVGPLAVVLFDNHREATDLVNAFYEMPLD